MAVGQKPWIMVKAPQPTQAGPSLSWFADNRDFPGIVAALSQRGFSDAELGKIMGGNWVDLLQRAAVPADTSTLS